MTWNSHVDFLMISMKQSILSAPTKVIRQLSLIVVMMMVIPSFNFYLSNIFLVWGFGSLVILIYGVLLLLMLYGIFIGSKYHLIKKSAVVISAVLAFMAFFSYLMYGDAIGDRLIRPDFHILYSELLYLFIFALPALLVASAARDWDLVVDKLIKIAPLIVAMAFYAWYLVGFRTWGDDSMNYMTLSYHVLTAGCICLAVSFTGVKPVYWIATLAFLFIMIGSGCRGALVCVFLFIVLLLIRQISVCPHSKTSRFIKIGFILLMVSLPTLYMTVFRNVANIFEQIGINSRVIESLRDNEFLSSNSRDNIRNAVLKGISDNPFGYGLYGDRYVTIKYYEEGSEYAHNILFEFLADYGVFLGPILLLVIIYLCYKCFHIYKGTNTGLALLFLVPDGFLKLFFSNSYLTDFLFFVFIGFLLSLNKNIFIKNG